MTPSLIYHIVIYLFHVTLPSDLNYSQTNLNSSQSTCRHYVANILLHHRKLGNSYLQEQSP